MGGLDGKNLDAGKIEILDQPGMELKYSHLLVKEEQPGAFLGSRETYARDKNLQIF